MKQAYRPEGDVSGRARVAGGKIVRLLLDESLTYQEADDALGVAQRLLVEQTVPTFPRRPD